MKSWIFLFIAAGFEIGWVVGLRSFTLSRPALATAILVSYLLSFVFLEKAVHGIPLGIAYSVWTGIGVVGAFAFAALLMSERPTLAQACFAGMILIGVIGMYATTTSQGNDVKEPKRNTSTEATAER